MLKFSKIKRKPGTRWNVDLEFIITFYDAYVREKNMNKVAACLEIRPWNLNDLIKRHPELQQAKEMADFNRVKGKLGNYALQHLSKEARKTWDKLQTVNSQEEIELIFKLHGKHGTKIRQQLFCTALLHSGYDVSKAFSVVGINRNILNGWRNDLEFMQMLEEIQFHKKNFFENQLLALCSDLHPGAVIFSNRTINADRGYNEKIEVTGSGAARPLGTTDYDIMDLLDYLDLDTQKKILAAIEKRKAEQGAEPDEDNDVDEPSPAQMQALTLVR